MADDDFGDFAGFSSANTVDTNLGWKSGDALPGGSATNNGLPDFSSFGQLEFGSDKFCMAGGVPFEIPSLPSSPTTTSPNSGQGSHFHTTEGVSFDIPPLPDFSSLDTPLEDQGLPGNGTTVSTLSGNLQNSVGTQNAQVAFSSNILVSDSVMGPESSAVSNTWTSGTATLPMNLTDEFSNFEAFSAALMPAVDVGIADGSIVSSGLGANSNKDTGVVETNSTTDIRTSLNAEDSVLNNFGAFSANAAVDSVPEVPFAANFSNLEQNGDGFGTFGCIASTSHGIASESKGIPAPSISQSDGEMKLDTCVNLEMLSTSTIATSASSSASVGGVDAAPTVAATAEGAPQDFGESFGNFTISQMTDFVGDAEFGDFANFPSVPSTMAPSSIENVGVMGDADPFTSSSNTPAGGGGETDDFGDFGKFSGDAGTTEDTNKAGSGGKNDAFGGFGSFSSAPAMKSENAGGDGGEDEFGDFDSFSGTTSVSASTAGGEKTVTTTTDDFGDFGSFSAVPESSVPAPSTSASVSDNFTSGSGSSAAAKVSTEGSGSGLMGEDEYGEFGGFSSGAPAVLPVSSSGPPPTQLSKHDLGAALKACYAGETGRRDASDVKEKVSLLQSLAKAIQNGPDKQTVEALKRSVWQSLQMCVDLTVPLHKFDRSHLQVNYYCCLSVDPKLESRPTSLSVLTGMVKFEDPLGGTTAMEDLKESFGFEGDLPELRSPPTSPTGKTGPVLRRDSAERGPALLDLSLPLSPKQAQEAAFTLAADLADLDLNSQLQQKKSKQLTSIEELLINEQLVVNRSTWVDAQLADLGETSTDRSKSNNSNEDSPADNQQRGTKKTVEIQLQELGLDVSKTTLPKGKTGELSLSARTLLGKLPDLSFMLYTDKIEDKTNYARGYS